MLLDVYDKPFILVVAQESIIANMDSNSYAHQGEELLKE